MSRRVVAIGLDAADTKLVDDWSQQGHLKNISQLRQRGGYAQLEGEYRYTAEAPWTMTFTGCYPETTGYWTPLGFDPTTYSVGWSCYDYERCPPFFNAGHDMHVTAFDLPQVVARHAQGRAQITTWGAHGPQLPKQSVPTGLRDEIVERFGEHPLLDRDYSDWWNAESVRFVRDQLKLGVRLRAEVCNYLLDRGSPDLFVTVFSEPHSAGHNLYHLSDPAHPLHLHSGASHLETDPMLEIYGEVDRALGTIIERLDDETTVVLFSPHGMIANNHDLTSMVFLPELMYRFSFPGQWALANGTPGTAPGRLLGVTGQDSGSWPAGVWAQRRRTLESVIPSFVGTWLRRFRAGPPALCPPFDPATAAEMPHAWQPPMWYRCCWPHMKAFALPSFSEGFIRINLAGREQKGVVSPADYLSVREELTRELLQAANARTGKPLVREVLATRRSPTDSPDLPDADLVVFWADEPCDVMDSPRFGRIGPVRYARTGGHTSQGFLIASGPGIVPGSRMRDGHPVDISATILDLLDAPIPSRLDGRPLTSHSSASRAA